MKHKNYKIGLHFIYVCILALILFQPQRVQASVFTLAKKGGDAYQVIALVNAVRAAYGLPDYTANAALMSAAQAHSEYQASIGSATHTGKGGSRAGDRAVAAGYGGGAKVYVTENIYSGRNATASIAVNWWQGDATHLNTIISPSHTDVGVGVAESNGVIYYTMDVGYIAGAAGQGSVSRESSSSGAADASGSSDAAVIIPVSAATPQADGSIIHTVKEGQALWNIAAIYNISITDLLALNGLTENSFIHPGDEMLVRVATTLTATQTITATQGITNPIDTDITPTLPITITQTATMVQKAAPSATPVIVNTSSNDPQPTIVVIVESDVSPTKKIDPVLLAISGLVVVGVFLVILGSITRKAN